MSNEIHLGELTVMIILVIFEDMASNLKKMAQFFQVSIHLHPYHSWQQKAGNSFSAVRKSFITKLDHYIWNSADAKTRFSF